MLKNNTPGTDDVQRARRYFLRDEAHETRLYANRFVRFANILDAARMAGISRVSVLALVIGGGKIAQFRAEGVSQQEYEGALAAIRRWKRPRDRYFEELATCHFGEEAE